MATTPGQKAGSSGVDAQVGQAWSQHFHGDNADAIQAFERIVASASDHIDANYGLALSLKKAGRKAEAIEAFNKTKMLLEATIAASTEDEETARLSMLRRMVDQHLAMM